jgi:dTDP-L-rhamnose 4-epimerase
LFSLHGLPTVVFNLAAETGTGQSLLEASRHGMANVVGTTQLTDALARHEHRPAHMVLTSSRAVYGEGAWRDQGGSVFYPPPRSEAMLRSATWDPIGPDGSPGTPLPHVAETTWPRPVNVYAATKLAQEHIMESWCQSFSVPLSILRLQNVYGPGQSVGNAYTGVLTFFARQLATGEVIDVYEDGQIIRDFVFVDDVVSALVAASRRPPSATRRLDIGSGSGVPLVEVAETMSSLADAPAPQISGRYRQGDVRAASASISAAAEQLGWAPAVPLSDGLQALSRWVSTQVHG